MLVILLAAEVRGTVLTCSLIFQQAYGIRLQSVSRRQPCGVYLKMPLVPNILHVRSNKWEVLGMHRVVISDVNGIDYLSGRGNWWGNVRCSEAAWARTVPRGGGGRGRQAGRGWARGTLSGLYCELQVFSHMIKAGHLFSVKCLQKQLFSKRFKEMWVW